MGDRLATKEIPQRDPAAKLAAEERVEKGFSDFSRVFTPHRRTLRRPQDVRICLERLCSAVGRGEVLPIDAWRASQMLRVALEIQEAQHAANADLHVVAKEEQPLKRVLVGRAPAAPAAPETKTEAV